MRKIIFAVLILVFSNIAFADEINWTGWENAKDKWLAFYEEYFEEMEAHDLTLPRAKLPGYKFEMKWVEVKSPLIDQYLKRYKIFASEHSRFALDRNGHVFCLGRYLPVNLINTASDFEEINLGDFLKKLRIKIDEKTAVDMTHLFEVIMYGMPDDSIWENEWKDWKYLSKREGNFWKISKKYVGPPAILFEVRDVQIEVDDKNYLVDIGFTEYFQDLQKEVPTGEGVIRKRVDLGMCSTPEFIGVKSMYYYYLGGKKIAVEGISPPAPIKGAIPDGVVREYYPSGQLKAEENFLNNQREGIAKTYYQDGKLESESAFKKNHLDGSRIEYYPNEQVRKEALFKAGSPVGTWRIFDPAGVLRKEQFFQEGKTYQEWVEKEYYPSGKLWQESTVRNDGKQIKQTGIRKVYYESGQLQLEEDTDHQTVTKAYYEDGKIHGVIRHKDGKDVGVEEYDRNGQLIKQESNIKQ